MLRIERNKVVSALLAEMAEALKAMQRGDYDQAYRILASRVEQSRITPRPPDWMADLQMARLLRQIANDSPLPVTAMSEALAAHAAAIVARVLNSESDAATVIEANAHLAEFGLILAIGEPD